MPPFTFQPRPRFHRRPLLAPAPAPPAPPGVAVHVVSVQMISAHFALWTFDHPATYEGGDVPQLVCQTGAGLFPPAELWQVSATQIAGNYDDGELFAGAAWQVLTMPENVDFAGNSLVVPESGSVG